MTTAVSNDALLRVQAVREQVTIFEVFDRMGVDYGQAETHQMRCPFHADRSPSARVYAEQNKLYCFTCQKSWDVIACVEDHFRLTFLDALSWLEREFALAGAVPSLHGALRTTLLRKAAPDMAVIAEQVEAILRGRREQLGFVRYTKALLALDLTVYEAPRLKPAELQQRLDAIVAAAR